MHDLLFVVPSWKKAGGSRRRPMLLSAPALPADSISEIHFARRPTNYQPRIAWDDQRPDVRNHIERSGAIVGNAGTVRPAPAAAVIMGGMDEVFGLFPTPFLRAPGTLSARLVDGLVQHFSALALSANRASDNLLPPAM